MAQEAGIVYDQLVERILIAAMASRRATLSR
jgi:hypothetical protein